MKKILFLLLSLSFSPVTLASSYSSIEQQLAPDELLFLSFSDHPDIFVDADSVKHLQSYHNRYLREPMYDDYLYVVLQKMLGPAGFKHLFRNLGGGFVPIRILDDQLVMKGTREHCGGMEEALIMVDIPSGHVISILYSEETFLIHSTLATSGLLPARAIKWVTDILNAYGTKSAPTSNKVLLRKMAGDWCHSTSL